MAGGARPAQIEQRGRASPRQERAGAAPGIAGCTSERRDSQAADPNQVPDMLRHSRYVISEK